MRRIRSLFFFLFLITVNKRIDHLKVDLRAWNALFYDRLGETSELIATVFGGEDREFEG